MAVDFKCDIPEDKIHFSSVDQPAMSEWYVKPFEYFVYDSFALGRMLLAYVFPHYSVGENLGG